MKMWKNMIKQDRPQMTIQYSACALHAGYLGLRTYNSEYSILIALLGKNGYANALH